MTVETLIDQDALRRKYREERDKRIKVKERSSYQYLEGELADLYDRDPWIASEAKRAPVSREVGAIILGGGFAGLTVGADLRKFGLSAQDVCIVERGGDFGGTWYWNRYPGLSCDIESYCYLPLLEETGYVPAQKYSMGPEIFEHSQRIGRHFGLYDGALFQTLVTGAIWNDVAARWIITTDRGDEIRARFFFLCGGAVNRPKLPGISGITDYEGHSFHTMRWDFAYTGGAPDRPLTNLRGKRVGLVGTGATAIQCVPPLGETAEHLYVFQRTPSAVGVRGNRPTDSAWAEALQPGWQTERLENFHKIVNGIPQDIDLVDDGWTQNARNMMHFYDDESALRVPRDVQERADFERMEEIRARVDNVVQDPATAGKLKAWYALLCKRPTFHDRYLDTFNQPNVTLVDTDGRGVERMTERGIVANGQEYELDCIVFATGFDTTAGLSTSLGVNPVGVGGVTLEDRLARDFSTLHGMMSSEFPNMFMMAGPQSTLAMSYTYGVLIQSEHCARLIQYCRDRYIERIEPRPEAEQAWKARLAEVSIERDEFYAECTPGYYNFEGESRGTFWEYYYGGGPIGYRREIRRWFDTSLESDMNLRKA